MSSSPLVSVLMPVYNGEPYLQEALESILAQTFTDFEFIVIDDGSTDHTGAILAGYEQRDKRLRVYRQDNQGLTAVLNWGIDLSLGRYIARMDADDISRPERLARQVAFMEVHPEVGVCGTWVETIGELGGQVWQYPVESCTIRCQLLFESALAHPSVMLNRELFIGAGLYYNPVYKQAQDYELWVRASQHFALANIPAVLLRYRLHSYGVGRRHNEEQLARSNQIRLIQLKNLNISPALAEVKLHQALGVKRYQANRHFVRQAEAWLRKLKAANNEARVYPEPAFSQVLGERWLAVCRAAAGLRWWTWRTFWQSPLSSDTVMSRRRKLNLAVRCFGGIPGR
ncbi:MAG: glycosyltransferase family A protein [Chloroflexota bacterium]